MNPGIVYAALAYLCWGLFPLYFKQLVEVPALEVVAHRTLWSLCFVALLLTGLRRWAWAPQVLRQPRVLGTFALSAALLLVNSLTYVWAIQHGRVLEASLGYFMNPLVNVALGFVFLRERPRPLQWAAVALAAFGVLWVTTHTGQAPWLALIIALSFGFYGLVRKTAPLGALEGLTLETLLVAPLAAGALLLWTAQGHSAFAVGSPSLIAWLLLAGPLTAIPLLLFAAGARRLPLTTLGLVQYISPSMQFALGVWLFREPLEPARLVAFGCIWAGLAVYSMEGVWRSRRVAAMAEAGADSG
ncbi:EamA family transporter RarD [Paucibacter sp. XJ19-41]|uniref:EamA family transporter RarD n=1 Tax=Paucibacter sp. XJ19-41 TaxID=2927824 RepID=UPI00234A45CA|nr:EamA family transporter RarD [Paucibacter sp. XJ19-41]MDC6168159.1 EamA family transporter RarD [Paucibacter sp. XJ19-41]